MRVWPGRKFGQLSTWLRNINFALRWRTFLWTRHWRSKNKILGFNILLLSKLFNWVLFCSERIMSKVTTTLLKMLGSRLLNWFTLLFISWMLRNCGCYIEIFGQVLNIFLNSHIHLVLLIRLLVFVLTVVRSLLYLLQVDTTFWFDYFIRRKVLYLF